MRYSAILIAVILTACSTNTQQDPQAEIIRILEMQENAYDHQTKENIQKFVESCTDSLIFIGGDDGGMLMTPELYVTDLADGYLKKPYNRKIQIYGNTAIVTSLHQGFKILAGDTLLLNCRATKVFVKDKDEWKMAYVTYAPLAVTYDKITTPNPAIFKNYVGIYDLGDGVRDSVYVENDKLFSSGSELLPTSDSTFIGEGYFGKAIFGKDHYTFEWIDGQRIRFNKIK